MARLPDFVGGPLFLGSWIEGGSAFDEWEHLTWSTNLSLGVIADTIIGPVFGGFSFGFEGGTRFYNRHPGTSEPRPLRGPAHLRRPARGLCVLGAVRGGRAHGVNEDDLPSRKATKEYLGEESDDEDGR
ncbi:MAG TPA: hypothetical protein VFO14_13870 [Vicinamibacterales bacterium]|nr:hypothetical protein [Vicinamibacterales bacterium]